MTKRILPTAVAQKKLHAKGTRSHLGAEATAVASGAAIGAVIGAAAGPPGIVAGAIVGGVMGAAAGVALDDQIRLDARHADEIEAIEAAADEEMASHRVPRPRPAHG